MSLLFNMLSRFVIAFLPRSKCLLISWLQSLSAVILECSKIKSITAWTFSPSICHKVIGLDAIILVFFKVEFQASLRRKRLYFKGHTQNLTCSGTQGKSNNLIEAWARLTCWSWTVFWRDGGQLQLTLRKQTLVSDIFGNILLCQHGDWWQWASWLISTKNWPHPTACRHQCWDASGQTSNWMGTKVHPTSDRLPKDFLSTQPPLDTPQGTILPTWGQRSSSITSGQAVTSPSRKPTLTPRPASSNMGEDTKTRKLWSHSLWTKSTDSKPDSTLGPAGPGPVHYQVNTSFKIPWTPYPTVPGTSLPTSDLKWALGYLGPAPRFQDPDLSTSSPALTPRPHFTCQWVGSSSRVFGTLTPSTNEPVVTPDPPGVVQPAASWLCPVKQQPAASTTRQSLANIYQTGGQTKPTRLPT